MSPDHHNLSWENPRSVSYLVKKSFRVVCPCDAGELDKTNFLRKSLDMMVLVNSWCQRIASAADIDRAKIATLMSIGSTMTNYLQRSGRGTCRQRDAVCIVFTRAGKSRRGNRCSPILGQQIGLGENMVFTLG